MSPSYPRILYRRTDTKKSMKMMYFNILLLPTMFILWFIMVAKFREKMLHDFLRCGTVRLRESSNLQNFIDDTMNKNSTRSVIYIFVCLYIMSPRYRICSCNSLKVFNLSRRYPLRLSQGRGQILATYHQLGYSLQTTNS